MRVPAPESLPSQGPTTIRAVADATLPAAAPAALAVLRRAVDVASARTARELEGYTINLGTAPDGQICMAVANVASDHTTLTCQPPDEVARASLWLGVGGAAEDGTRFFGVAPDGVDEVLLTEADGANHRVPVVNNAFAARLGPAVARVEWSGRAGAKADLRLPTVP